MTERAPFIVTVRDGLGEVTLLTAGPEALIAAYRALLTHPDFVDSMDSLWDMREVESPLLGSEVMPATVEAEELIRTTGADRSGRRVAVIVGSDLTFGVTRMFAGLAGGRLPMVFEGFREEEEARGWLRSGREEE